MYSQSSSKLQQLDVQYVINDINGTTQGFRYASDNLDTEPQIDSKEFIENDCNRLDQKQIQEFIFKLDAIPVSMQKFFPSKNQLHKASAQKQNQVIVNAKSSCQKCMKNNSQRVLYQCSNCEAAFHLQCLPRNQIDYYCDQNDICNSVQPEDLLNSIITREYSKDECENIYSDRGFFDLIQLRQTKVSMLCQTCYETSCFVCRKCENTQKCTICDQYYHQYCQLPNNFENCNKSSSADGFVCSWCQFDGGVNQVEKIISVKCVDLENLQQLVKQQFFYFKHCNNLDFNDYCNDIRKSKQIVNPINICLQDQIIFLCKFKNQSYCRSKYISMRRMFVICKQLLISNNMYKPFHVFYGIKEDFGLNKAVDLKLTCYYIDDQDEDAEDYIQLVDASQEDENATCHTVIECLGGNSKTKFHSLATLGQVAIGFEKYAEMSYIQYLTQNIDQNVMKAINNRLNIVSDIINEKVCSYKQLLIENGVDSNYLEVDQVISRFNDSYLIKWKTMNYDQSTFESIYYCYNNNQQAAFMQFFLEQSGFKIQNFIKNICLDIKKKTWWDYKAETQLQLGVHRDLTHIPPYLAIDQKQLFQFQITGINWLLFTHLNNHGCLFCDQMGLGKTIQISCFIACLAEYGSFGTHLIIVPTSTIENWTRELRKWLPFLNIGVLNLVDVESVEIMLKSQIKARMFVESHKIANEEKIIEGTQIGNCNSQQEDLSAESRKQILNQLKEYSDQGYVQFQDQRIQNFNGCLFYNVILLSYDSINNFNSRQLGKFSVTVTNAKTQKKEIISLSNGNAFNSLNTIFGPFSTIILDEGHRIKGGQEVLLYKLLNKIIAKQRIILTGTPVQNNFFELTNLLAFVDPVFFNTNKINKLMGLAEKASFPECEKTTRDQLLKELHDIIKPFMLVRSQTDVFKQPISKEEIFVPIDLTQIQKQLYGKLIYDNRKKLKNEQQKIQFVAVMAAQLRHISNHPILLNKNYQQIANQKISLQHLIQMSSKFQFFDKLLTQLLEDKRKVLVYSQFVMMLNLFEILLCKKEIRFLRIDGSVGSIERQKLIDKFNDPTQNFQVFILSTNAGGMGINLQAASDIIIYDSSWNPQIDNQAIHRAVRIGQEKTVRIYRLFCRNSMDQKIIERAKKKLSITYMLVRPLASQKTDSIDEILAFGCRDIMSIFKDNIKNQSLDQMKENLLQNDVNQEEQINYSDAEIHELINQKNQEQDTQAKNELRSGQIDKNEFLSGFKYASFTLINKEDQKQDFEINQKKKTQTKQQKVEQSVDNHEIWGSLFNNIFGEDSEEREESRRRQEQRIKRQRAMRNISFTSDSEERNSDEYTDNPDSKAFQRRYNKNQQYINTKINMEVQKEQHSELLQLLTKHESDITKNDQLQSNTRQLQFPPTNFQYQQQQSRTKLPVLQTFVENDLAGVLGYKEVDIYSKEIIQPSQIDQQVVQNLLEDVFGQTQAEADDTNVDDAPQNQEMNNVMLSLLKEAFNSYHYPMFLSELNSFELYKQLIIARQEYIDKALQGCQILLKHTELSVIHSMAQVGMQLISIDNDQIQQFLDSSEKEIILQNIQQNQQSQTIYLYKNAISQYFDKTTQCYKTQINDNYMIKKISFQQYANEVNKNFQTDVVRQPMMINYDIPSLVTPSKCDQVNDQSQLNWQQLCQAKQFLHFTYLEMLIHYYNIIFLGLSNIQKIEHIFNLVSIRRMSFELYIKFSRSQFDDKQVGQVFNGGYIYLLEKYCSQINQSNKQFNLQLDKDSPLQQSKEIQNINEFLELRNTLEPHLKHAQHFTLDMIQNEMKQISVLIMKEYQNSLTQKGYHYLNIQQKDIVQQMFAYYQQQENQVILFKVMLSIFVGFQIFICQSQIQLQFTLWRTRNLQIEHMWSEYNILNQFRLSSVQSQIINYKAQIQNSMKHIVQQKTQYPIQKTGNAVVKISIQQKLRQQQFMLFNYFYHNQLTDVNTDIIFKIQDNCQLQVNALYDYFIQIGFRLNPELLKIFFSDKVKQSLNSKITVIAELLSYLKQIICIIKPDVDDIQFCKILNSYFIYITVTLFEHSTGDKTQTQQILIKSRGGVKLTNSLLLLQLNKQQINAILSYYLVNSVFVHRISTMFNELNSDKQINESYLQLNLNGESEEILKRVFNIGDQTIDDKTNILPYLETNRLLNREFKRNQLTQFYKEVYQQSFQLAKGSHLIQKSIIPILNQINNQEFLCLLGGTILVLLYRYGYKQYIQYCCQDNSANLQKLLEIIIQNIQDKDEFKQINYSNSQFYQQFDLEQIDHPYQILLNNNFTSSQKCSVLGNILFQFVVTSGIWEESQRTPATKIIGLQEIDINQVMKINKEQENVINHIQQDAIQFDKLIQQFLNNFQTQVE